MSKTVAKPLARPVEHHYHSSGIRFWIVECGRCNTALNSGHHYSDDALIHAERLAADHNAASHDNYS